MFVKNRAVLLFAAAAFLFAAALVAGGYSPMSHSAGLVADGLTFVTANFVVIGAGNLKAMRQGLTELKRVGQTKTAEYNTLAAKAQRTAEEDARLAALDAELEQLEANVATQSGAIEAEERRSRRTAAFAVPENPTPAPAPQRRAAFSITSNEPDPVAMGGFNSLAELATCVRSAHHGVGDQRLAALPTSTIQQGDASGIGYEIPPAMRQQIWELVFDGSDMLSFVQPEPTSSPAIYVPTDESTPWGAAGVKAFWRKRGGQLQATKPSSSAELVAIHPLDAFVVADEILLNDAPRLNDRLTRRAAQAIRWTASEAIVWGDGVGQPLGFMKAGSKIAIAKESGQAGGTIALQNVLKMSTRILRGGAPLVWAGNSEIIPQVAQLTIGNVPLWLANNQGIQSEFVEGSLNGRPLNIMEHCSALGDEGDLMLINPAGYYAATSNNGTIDAQASIHLYFDYAATAFRWTFRMGGQPLLKKAVDPAHGTATKSHFVTIAARSGS
jgi:HK97 family phage major capsid protein